VDPAVAISQLRVVRGRLEVLAELSLTVDRGTVTGLLGPSGSGKTTLLRAIVGVQRVASGDVTVLGQPAGSAHLRSIVGYMTQAPSVYGDLTVTENLTFFARILGAATGRIAAVVADVDLGAHQDQLVRDLSGGERARVSLATALLNDRRYSCSTSRPSASTRCFGATCGRCSTGWPPPAPPCWSRVT